MKFKCFTLIVILVIIFSLGTVAASENITSDSSSFDDDCLAIGYDYISIDEGFNEELGVSQGDSSINGTDNSTDLSVRIDVKNTYVKNQFNRAGFEVPWTITLSVTGGIAYNTRVYETLPSNMEYVSHNATMGEYDSASGIWYVGDLNSSSTPSLKIVTKIKADGRFTNKVNAVTDSNDIDLSNNAKSLTIKSGESKTASNTTETSDHKNEPQHSDHQSSQGSSLVGRETLEENADDASSEDSSDSGTKMRSNENSAPSQSSNSNSINPVNEKNSDSSAKASSSGTEKISDAVESLTGSIISILDSSGSVSDAVESLTDSIFGIFDSSGSGSDDSDSNSSNDSSKSQAKSISGNDYTKIPMLIFGLFLIVLVAYFGYNKIKS